MNKKKILILGATCILIASIIIPQYFSHVDTKVQKARMEILFLGNVLESYKELYGFYPAIEEGIDALVTGDSPLLDHLPKDPWGAQYNYLSPGLKRPGKYDLWSYGQDGLPGGVGDDADIYIIE